MSDLVVFDLSKPKVEDTKPKNYRTAKEFACREAIEFVIVRCGRYVPWDPNGWPDEVKDEGCRCHGHSFEHRMLNGEPTNIWVCTECKKPKPLMNYVEWCVSCGIPYVVSKSPDRTKLCINCGG